MGLKNMFSSWSFLPAKSKLLSLLSIPFLLILISVCNPSKNDSETIQRIESYPEEIIGFKNQLQSIEFDNLKIKGKELNVTLRDGSKMEFVWLPPTTSKEWRTISGGRDYFLMGDNKRDYSPLILVKLDYGYFVAKTEVTQKQWMQLMINNPSQKNKSNDAPERFPVDSVSWTESRQFIQKFSRNYSMSFFDTIKRIIFFRDYVFRLPTEAEWEYASSAGMFEPTREYLEETTWYGHPSRSSQPVASKQPNPWGIYDMLGNVFEITIDCWPTEDDIKFGDESVVRVNPLGSSNKVNARGGAWFSSRQVKSFGSRGRCYLPHYKGKQLGFRLVLAPPLPRLNKGGYTGLS